MIPQTLTLKEQLAAVKGALHIVPSDKRTRQEEVLISTDTPEHKAPSVQGSAADIEAADKLPANLRNLVNLLSRVMERLQSKPAGSHQQTIDDLQSFCVKYDGNMQTEIKAEVDGVLHYLRIANSASNHKQRQELVASALRCLKQLRDYVVYANQPVEAAPTATAAPVDTTEVQTYTDPEMLDFVEVLRTCRARLIGAPTDKLMFQAQFELESLAVEYNGRSPKTVQNKLSEAAALLQAAQAEKSEQPKRREVAAKVRQLVQEVESFVMEAHTEKADPDALDIPEQLIQKDVARAEEVVKNASTKVALVKLPLIFLNSAGTKDGTEAAFAQAEEYLSLLGDDNTTAPVAYANHVAVPSQKVVVVLENSRAVSRKAAWNTAKAEIDRWNMETGNKMVLVLNQKNRDKFGNHFSFLAVPANTAKNFLKSEDLFWVI